MDWDSVTWASFIKGLTDYRDREYLKASRVSGEHAYLSVLEEFAPLSILERRTHVDSLILFLNRWSCHFPTKTAETRTALTRWIEREASALGEIATATLCDEQLSERIAELERLYASLIALRQAPEARIPTMGDAAASKILHLMVPDLFVMWDREIKKGGWGYGRFMLRMRDLAIDLRETLAPPEARSDVEGYLQHELGYPVRKSLAKFIDEFNWWLAWNPEP